MCEDEQLVIKHKQAKKEAIFDLCSFDGKIILSGELDTLNEQTSIDLKNISKGKYQLFVIQDGTVFRKCIQS